MADLRKTDVVYITNVTLRWEAIILLCENVIMIMMMLSMVLAYFLRLGAGLGCRGMCWVGLWVHKFTWQWVGSVIWWVGLGLGR